jgi:hypothetical protein
MASAQATKPVPVSAKLDGLAFVSPGGGIQWVKDGKVETVWQPLARYGGIDSTFGVGYSLGHQWLLYGAGIVEVTDNGVTSDELVSGPTGNGQGSGGDADGHSYSMKAQNNAALLVVPAAAGGEAKELLHYNSLPQLDHVCYDETTGQVWVSEPTDGPSTVMFTLQAPYSKPQLMTLGSHFSGDYTVSPDGSTIVYLDTSESPAIATLRVSDQEVQLPLELQTAYDPVFSPNGSKICFVGSDGSSGQPGLWIYDVKAGSCTLIEGSEGLTPTYPVFSRDGKTIAFRNWSLGDLWTIPVDGGSATRYDLPVMEAPIAW